MTPSDTPPPVETRISTLVGDRMCISCGYNLVGQPILRESHYDMLIVRCPECATVASVQEYPLLGRWANRWAAVLATLWLGVLIVLWLGTSAAIFGMSVGSAEMAAEQYADVLYERFSEWQTLQAASAAANATAAGQVVVTTPRGIVQVGNTGSFSAWWQQQDAAALFREAGGLRGGFGIYVWYIWMWLAIVATFFGIIWATFMLGRGRLGLLAWAMVIILTACALGLIPMMDWWARAPNWTHQAASQQIGPTMMGLSLMWALLWLVVGLMFGRPIARRLVLLLLPPRMRSTMAFLWLTDGREPPKQTLKR